MLLRIPSFRRTLTIGITQKPEGSKTNIQIIKDVFLRTNKSKKAGKQPAIKTSPFNNREPDRKYRPQDPAKLKEFAQQGRWKKFNQEMNMLTNVYNQSKTTKEEKAELEGYIQEGSKIAVDYKHPNTSSELRRYVEELRSKNIR